MEKKDYPIPAIFEDYVYQAHASEIINKEHDVTATYRNIGVFKGHLVDYDIFTCFRRIKLANGFRGRSLIGFIDSTFDTLLYEADMATGLPVDIYKNHFVFQRADSSYFFQKPDTICTEMCCFQPPLYCLMSY